MTLAPNPVVNYTDVTFALSTSVSNISFLIIDALGRRIYEQRISNIPAGDQSIRLDNLSTIPKGIYFLSVQADQQYQLIKFVKE